MTAETYAEVFEYGGLAGRFASIDYVDALGGYEWDEFHVLRGADGRLYIGANGGCSCNSFTDTEASQFTVVDSWQQAADEALLWAEEEEWARDRRRSVAMNLVERLAQKRPEPRIEIDARKPFGGAS